MPHLLDTMQSTFWFIITISIIVFVHEYGHFFFARLFGVRVETFSIGFGKELIGYNDKFGTRWKVCLIPLGGYVKMFGDADPASVTTTDSIEHLSDDEKQKTFHYKSIWKKSVIVAAGPLFNFLLAILILSSIYMIHGRVMVAPEVGEVTINSPAYEAGLSTDDLILRVNKQDIYDYQELFNAVIFSNCQPIELKVLRGTVYKDITITPRLVTLDNSQKMPSIGVKPKRIDLNRLNVFEALSAATIDTYRFSSNIIEAVGHMIKGRSIALGGPLEIAKQSKQSIEFGYIQFAKFIALLSINLGLVNLFPIPMLDGGHLVFYGIEKIKRKPLSTRFQAIASRIGIALLSTLMLFAIFNDLKSLFN